MEPTKYFEQDVEFFPILEGETTKAHKRRVREGWYDKYAPSHRSGIDIGSGPDPINHSFRRWDKRYGEGDGVILEGVPPNTFHTVYCSHVLEHIDDTQRAIARWYEVLRPGGHLIIMVPHRDLYEQKKELPSYFNIWHKHFWLPEQEEAPCTKSLKKEVLQAIPDANIVSLRVLDEGYVPGDMYDLHALGEYSIEIIIQKPEAATSQVIFGQFVTYPSETKKSEARRMREGWFSKYCPSDMSGIDIGCGLGTVNPAFRRWDMDLKEGDGATLIGVPANTFHTVYTSHLLEHLQYPRQAIARWYEVLRPGGHLIIVVPHRDLFEQKTELPSNKNPEHKHFWLPEEEDYPWTKSLKGEVLEAIPNAKIVSLQVLDSKCEDGDNEYSIEIIIHKPALD